MGNFQSISETDPSAMQWTQEQITLWLCMLAIAAFLALCRLFRNGQWRNWRHASGVIGCSVGLSYVVAVLAYAGSETVRNNQAVLLACVILPALMGRKLHDQFIAQLAQSLLGASIEFLEKFRGRSKGDQDDRSTKPPGSGD